MQLTTLDLMQFVKDQLLATLMPEMSPRHVKRCYLMIELLDELWQDWFEDVKQSLDSA